MGGFSCFVFRMCAKVFAPFAPSLRHPNAPRGFTRGPAQEVMLVVFLLVLVILGNVDHGTAFRTRHLSLSKRSALLAGPNKVIPPTVTPVDKCQQMINQWSRSTANPAIALSRDYDQMCKLYEQQPVPFTWDSTPIPQCLAQTTAWMAAMTHLPVWEYAIHTNKYDRPAMVVPEGSYPSIMAEIWRQLLSLVSALPTEPNVCYVILPQFQTDNLRFHTFVTDLWVELDRYLPELTVTAAFHPEEQLLSEITPGPIKNIGGISDVYKYIYRSPYPMVVLQKMKTMSQVLHPHGSLKDLEFLLEDSLLMLRTLGSKTLQEMLDKRDWSLLAKVPLNVHPLVKAPGSGRKKHVPKKPRKRTPKGPDPKYAKINEQRAAAKAKAKEDGQAGGVAKKVK